MKFKLHHIAISVFKLNESINFYKDIFGFQEYCKYQSEDMEIWLLELEGIKLELFYFKNNKKMSENSKELSTDLPEIGVKHFGLTTENLEECRNKLINKGVEIITRIKEGKNPVEYFFIKDPNGILVEIIKDKK